MISQVINCLDGVTIVQVVHRLNFPFQLVIVPRLGKATVILIKIIELVVNVNRFLKGVVDLEDNRALFPRATHLFILNFVFFDVGAQAEDHSP